MLLIAYILLIVCSDGFTGMNCETNIDDCATNPCVNGTCTDLVDGYNCTCQAGFTGTNCSTTPGDVLTVTWNTVQCIYHLLTSWLACTAVRYMLYKMCDVFSKLLVFQCISVT